MSDRGAGRGGGRILAPAPDDQLRPLAVPPTFSVVVVAYQAAATAVEAVRSALDQAHPAHEVIVVDDGSTDGLAAALRPFAGEITLIRKENGGAASARNVGIAAATGDFVAFLDADDRFHPGRLEALAELACRRPDLDLISTDMRFVVAGSDAGSFLADNEFAIEDQRREILRSCFIGAPPAVRTPCLRAVGGFDEGMRVAEDWDCWLRLILAGAEVGLVDRPYYDYVLHSGTLTSSRVESLWGRVHMLEKAAANPALRAGELSVVEHELRRRRHEAVLEEIRTSSKERRRLSKLVLMPRLGFGARAAVALALLSPALARRLVSGRQPPAERLADSKEQGPAQPLDR